MNAPATFNLDQLDDIRTLMGPIADDEYERRAKLRSYRNAATAMISATQSDTARTLAWAALDWITPWLYAPAPAEFLDMLTSLVSRLLRTAICRALGVPIASLAGMMAVASLRGELDNALAVESPEGGYQPTCAYQGLARLVRSTRAKLVALDNIAHLFAGNENDRGEVTRFVNLLNRLAGETGAAILLIGHPNKAGDNYSGSTAWLNAVRSQVVLHHCVDTDIRTLTVGKANYGRKGEEIRFAWVDWAFVLEGDLAPNTARALAETARAQAENAAFIACLRAREAQGEGRQVGPAPGPNFAPTQFEGMPEAKGFKRDRLRAAMERLFETREIETHTFRNKAKARDVTIIREVPRSASRTVPAPFPNGTPNPSRSPP